MYQTSHSNHYFSLAGLWLSVFSPALLQDVAEGRLVVFVGVKSGKEARGARAEPDGKQTKVIWKLEHSINF